MKECITLPRNLLFRVLITIQRQQWEKLIKLAIIRKRTKLDHELDYKMPNNITGETSLTKKGRPDFRIRKQSTVHEGGRVRKRTITLTGRRKIATCS
ncbi:hypothetical protein CEXT_756961 [Caerostris extrusa]|uniref:Uncharacterized protein n=1 Tax=Caerostris extrusa TaxID=172846 RepID=A0AAV4PQX1_CAEEX|nr:hypothetical protein CEXT_756961 [Caerostris extrusa]